MGPTFSRARLKIIIRKEDVKMLLAIEDNLLTKKLNGRLMIRRPLGRIERRRHVAIVERWDMWRKCVGRRAHTWKRRISNLKEV